MRVTLALVAGFAVGFAIASRLRPANESSCCVRVAAGARDKVGEACGILGPVCQSLGDTLGIWRHAPSILDRWGL
jgi:hypothetical protein